MREHEGSSPSPRCVAERVAVDVSNPSGLDLIEAPGPTVPTGTPLAEWMPDELAAWKRQHGQLQEVIACSSCLTVDEEACFQDHQYLSSQGNPEPLNTLRPGVPGRMDQMRRQYCRAAT